MKIRLSLLPILLAASVAAEKVSPYSLADGTWITIDGKVTETSRDAFTLNYGEASILVEMDDYDWYPEGTDIFKGDRVVVTGKIDADAGEQRSIEAGSVFVKGEKVSFFANAEDEEGGRKGQKRDATDPNNRFSFYGTVAGINGKDFVLDTGYQIVTVNTSLLSEDAFDNEGAVQISVGDKISATGKLSDGYFAASSLDATSILEGAKPAAD